MERLGHSSITVTMDTYGHLLPSLDDELTEALEGRFRSISRPRVDEMLAIACDRERWRRW